MGPDNGFLPDLSWSHYRVLMRIENKKARQFYENEAVARYSVLNESKQLFAAKYVTYLPSEKELERELHRERQRLEESK